MKAAKGEVKYASVSAVVTRANGRVEDLGPIATSRKPEWFWLAVERLAWRLKKGVPHGDRVHERG